MNEELLPPARPEKKNGQKRPMFLYLPLLPALLTFSARSPNRLAFTSAVKQAAAAGLYLENFCQCEGADVALLLLARPRQLEKGLF